MQLSQDPARPARCHWHTRFRLDQRLELKEGRMRVPTRRVIGQRP